MAVGPGRLSSLRRRLPSSRRGFTACRSGHCENYQDHKRQMDTQSRHSGHHLSRPNELIRTTMPTSLIGATSSVQQKPTPAARTGPRTGPDSDRTSASCVTTNQAVWRGAPRVTADLRLSAAGRCRRFRPSVSRGIANGAGCGPGVFDERLPAFSVLGLTPAPGIQPTAQS
jgi:hypothetical protein